MQKCDWLIGINELLKRVEILRCYPGKPNQGSHLIAVTKIVDKTKVPKRMKEMYERVVRDRYQG